VLGETIGHYRVTERLGAGAMGEVFLAEDTRLHRPVALKMLPAEARGDEAAAARLVREARVASALAHPNIAVIYEIGEVEREGRRHGFIAMEYIPGRTLSDVAEERRLDVAEILTITRQVADALAEARGVVHRDIKPAALDLAVEAFERRVRSGADDPSTRYYAACAYALRGDADAALESLEKVIPSRRRFNVAKARVEPALESLRGQERFRVLVGP
jgi:hypothetical protein